MSHPSTSRRPRALLPVRYRDHLGGLHPLNAKFGHDCRLWMPSNGATFRHGLPLSLPPQHLVERSTYYSCSGTAGYTTRATRASPSSGARSSERSPTGPTRAIPAWIVKIGDSRSEVYLRVRNLSEERVWNCCVRVRSHWAPTHEVKWERLQVLPPQETVSITVGIELPDGLTVNPPAEVTFTDSVGATLAQKGSRGT